LFLPEAATSRALGGLPTAPIDELDTGVLKRAGQSTEGKIATLHRRMLALELKRFEMFDHQIAARNGLIALAMTQHQHTVTRVAGAPGPGVDSA
jgi:hypothetical protein